MTRSLTEQNKSVKRRSYCDEQQQNTSNKYTRPEMTYSATMNDLSKMQRSKNYDDYERSNCVEYSPEKIYTKNIEYININHEYDEMNEKLSNINYLSDNNCSSNADSSIRDGKNNQIISVSLTRVSSSSTSNKDTSNANLDVFNVSNNDVNSDDTLSEAGTYTIHKDYTDEEKSRMDIDKAFSVGVLTEEESNEIYVNHFKMRSKHDNNTWIKEWATQVAEHNHLPSTTGRTPPPPPQPMSPSKIPSPIYLNSRRQKNKTHYEQSDSSSLDADIQQQQQQKCGLNNSNNLIDSGGESDEDTSNSYPTPPHSSQRTPTHVRRASLSEALFKRVNNNNNNNDFRQSMRKYPDNMQKSPSHQLSRLQLEQSNSLDRKDIYSDTAESNSRIYHEDNYKHTNSPILNRLRSTTPKLTNSPILGHKKIINNSPSYDRSKHLVNFGNSSSKYKNTTTDYYNCMEGSPYMLRKSNSTSNYREITKTPENNHHYQYGSPIFQRNNSIKRSSSNHSIRNTKANNNSLARHGSFNEKIGSDSSSETGDNLLQKQKKQILPPPPPISSGIKLNRAFSIRRGRLNNDSDTTPEERRRGGGGGGLGQIEIKSAPTSARQTNHHRARTSSVGACNKEQFKKPEQSSQRGPSLSRNEVGRYSMRVQKSTINLNSQVRTNQKLNRDGKNSGRSNSTLTSKEVEFQNWKRRQSYNPLKAAAVGKKKTVDVVTRKHHSIDDEQDNNNRDNSVLRSASFHGTRGTLSLADDWSDNDNNFIESREILQVPPPSSPLYGSDSDLDTSSYLQTTHNVMSAMTARMTVYHRTSVAPVDSGGESDDDTSQSLRQTNKIHHNNVSDDTESSDDTQRIHSTNLTKFNRSFGIRRAREQQDIKTIIKPANNFTNNNLRAKSESPSIARTDSGRFSMRASKGNCNSVKVKPKDKKQILQQNLKEQEMQNWKRRKSYDPKKAAMEGKRKADMAKRNTESSR